MNRARLDSLKPGTRVRLKPDYPIMVVREVTGPFVRLANDNERQPHLLFHRPGKLVEVVQ